MKIYFAIIFILTFIYKCCFSKTLENEKKYLNITFGIPFLLDSLYQHRAKNITGLLFFLKSFVCERIEINEDFKNFLFFHLTQVAMGNAL